MGLALPAESASLWNTIHREAVAVAAAEPALAAWMHEAVVNQSNLASALAQLIAVAVSGSRDEKTVTRRIAERAYRDDPSLIEIATLDLRAPLDRDPACPGPLHVLLHFKGYIALQAYRISHRLWESGRTEFAREVHGRITQALHVSIHPSVTIGSALFIDHGTGITIGEGVVIGEDVSMLQEVTLSSSPEGEAGAPRIGRGVLLSAGATVLGNVDIGDFAKIGAGSLVLASVPSGYSSCVGAVRVHCSRRAGTAGRPRIRRAARVKHGSISAVILRHANQESGVRLVEFSHADTRSCRRFRSSQKTAGGW